MRKMLLLATMVALAVMMMAAAPAMAQEFDADDVEFFCDNDDDNFNGFIECEDLFVVIPVGDFEEFCEDFDGDFFCDDFDRFDGFGSGSEFEDVGASIDVSPTLTFESDQAVNQPAVAVGDMKHWW